MKVKRKRALGRRNAPGSRCEDFIPWVPDDRLSPGLGGRRMDGENDGAT